MKKVIIFFILIVAGVIAYLFSIGEQHASNSSHEPSAPKTTNSTSPATPPSKTTPSPQEIEQGLAVAANIMQNMGFKPLPPAIDPIQEAIDSGDFTKVRVAFNELIYHGIWEPAQVISALEHFLRHENPKVRFLAAQGLYIVGSKNGLQVMLDLMKSNDKIDGGYGVDLRMQAAQTLTKFRVHEAKDALFELYGRTKGPELTMGITLMGYQLPNEDSYKFISGEYVLRKYAQTGVTKWTPQIQQVFEKSSKSADQMAAAWALAVLNQDPMAFDFLKQKALDVSPPQGKQSQELCESLKYIGSIEGTTSKEILEKALESSHSHAVEIAIVNLLYNQGGSTKALEVIAERLKNTNTTVSLEFILNITPQLLHYPEIKTAGDTFKDRSTLGMWRRKVVERKDWPIYNWIDKYVVKLKNQP